MLKINIFTKLFALFIATAVIVSMWATSVNAQVQLTERSKLAINGIGPIRVGMTVAEASRAAGVRLIKSYAPPNEEFCSYFKPQEQPQGINFMVTKGRIVRIDISNEQITTIKGFKVGDTEEQIIKAYPGQIRIIKNPLSGRGNNLTFVPRDAADSNYRLIFQTGIEGRVRYFRSGQLPQVEYIEGCS
ncbi:hypothetical protein QUB68_24570 [Microcoleus sp. A006_D1]|uniref:hypothetical protein n=1 Tax=Microcoleus sp. A006_D1 TaxID=3055267 RepID=UPI002FD7751F